MAARIAGFVALFLVLLPSGWRLADIGNGARAACAVAGRGAAPRTWIGCEEAPGPTRQLTVAERLISGLTLDLNGSPAEDLAQVPGLSISLAKAVVVDRATRGAFPRVDDLQRVRGIGRARLEKARRHLHVGPDFGE